MLTRRHFLGQASLIAGLTAAGDTPFAQVSARTGGGQNVDAKLLVRAQALLAQAPLIDTHNDLPWMLLATKANDLTGLDMGNVQPTLCADIPRLREGRVGAQYWSIYVDASTQKAQTSLHDALRQFDVALRFIRSRPELELARTARDIDRIHQAGRIASLLGVEGGYMAESSPAALRVFHELGARYLTLTHSDNIPWADSATDRAEHRGLTEFGKRMVRELNRLGMFVDISHVSPETMLDALSVTLAPVIFSHSNAFAIDPHPRNVPDEVLRLLAKNGGVVHVNFINAFVSPETPIWQAKRTAALKDIHARVVRDDDLRKETARWDEANPQPRGTIPDVADHIDHIREVAGIDHIGMGADFYDAGRSSMAMGLDDVTRYPYLFAELLRRGYSDGDVFKIAGRNHLRAMRQMEDVAARLEKAEPPLTMEGPRSGLR